MALKSGQLSRLVPKGKSIKKQTLPASFSARTDIRMADRRSIDQCDCVSHLVVTAAVEEDRNGGKHFRVLSQSAIHAEKTAAEG